MPWWHFSSRCSKAITPCGRLCLELPVLCGTGLRCSLLPPFVGQIQASVNPATCTIRLSLTELRIFSASKYHSLPYEDKWKGVQAVNLLRFTFLPSGFLQLLDHSLKSWLVQHHYRKRIMLAGNAFGCIALNWLILICLTMYLWVLLHSRVSPDARVIFPVPVPGRELSKGS